MMYGPAQSSIHRQWRGCQVHLALGDGIHEFPDVVRKLLVIRYGDHGVIIDNIPMGCLAWDAQAPAQDLGDQELRFENPLLHGNDLEDIVHIPPLGELVHGEYEFRRLIQTSMNSADSILSL